MDSNEALTLLRKIRDLFQVIVVQHSPTLTNLLTAIPIPLGLHSSGLPALICHNPVLTEIVLDQSEQEAEDEVTLISTLASCYTRRLSSLNLVPRVSRTVSHRVGGQKRLADPAGRVVRIVLPKVVCIARPATKQHSRKYRYVAFVSS